MELELSYESEDDIPSGFAQLYTEKDDKWVLTGVKGMKTQADVDRLQQGISAERKKTAEVKQRLSAYRELGDDPAEVRKTLDRVEDLEAQLEAAGGKLDDDKVNELVEKRAKARVAPLERENKQLKTRATELEGKVTELTGTLTKRDVHADVRTAATKAGVRPEAIDDALMLADRVFERSEDGKTIVKEGVGFVPGVDPSEFFSELKDRKPHWWPESEGAGSKGSGGRGGKGGENPWSHDGWNLTKQGAYVREHGREKADRMAKLAGTKVGGLKPAAPKK